MPMVRKARCPTCGSPKATPTSTAYIYCDYCGQLMDFDVGRYHQQATTPSPEFVAFDNKLQKKINGARGGKDREQLMGLYRQQIARSIDEYGTTFSPRAKDPEFRARLIEYLAFQRVVGDLSPRVKASAKAVSEANRGWEVEERDGRVLIKPAALWRIIEAHQAAAKVYQQEMLNLPDPVPDPDHTPPAVAAQLGAAVYIAAFMTMIDDETAKELLRRTGLESGYEEVAEPELHTMFCGHCGTKQHVVGGARRVLCESCGKHAEVGHPTSCHSCGSRVTIGVGGERATCEHCRAEVRLVARLT